MNLAFLYWRGNTLVKFEKTTMVIMATITIIAHLIFLPNFINNINIY